MITLNTEIIIPATPEKIWAVLTNFEEYGTWNSFIPKIMGKLQAGEKLKVMIAPPHAKTQEFSPILLKIEQDHEIRWAGKFMADLLFRGEHFIQLVPMGATQTKVIHGEIFTGILTPLFAKQLQSPTYQGFLNMNQDLAKQVAAIDN